MSIKRTLIASALMILTAVCIAYFSNIEDTALHKPFSTFPKQIGDWTGKELRFDQQVYDVLGVDDSFLCDYQTIDGRYINLYIGFYQSQRKGDLIHSPKNCMPGSGWNITSSSLEELTVADAHQEKNKGIKLILEKGNRKQVMFYWFQSRGRYISSEYMQKVYLVIDSITRHRTDGSFVRLITPVAGNDEKKALKELQDFTKLLLPILQQYIPS